MWGGKDERETTMTKDLMKTSQSIHINSGLVGALFEPNSHSPSFTFEGRDNNVLPSALFKYNVYGQ
jgi:hypothetical protein